MAFADGFQEDPVEDLAKPDKKSSLPKQTLAKNKQPRELVQRRNLEFKVTPYRIQNMTSKRLIVRRCQMDGGSGSQSSSHGSRHPQAHAAPAGGQPTRSGHAATSKSGGGSRLRNNLTNHPLLQQPHSASANRKQKNDGDDTPVHQPPQVEQQRKLPARGESSHRRVSVRSKYYLDSGGSCDYEVDDEEEARQLVKSFQDDLARKQDFVDFIFDEGRREKDKIRAYNLAGRDLHQHPFSAEPYDFIIFGMCVAASKVRRTIVLRSPFIIFNKTESVYMLKMVRYQTSEEIILKIAPGGSYPLSHSELKAKISLALASDYYDAQAKPQQYSQRQEEIWSTHFKVSSFFQKHDVSKKKFFLFHACKFSMVFVEPGAFFPAWDICIKVPLIVRNCLPCGLKVRTLLVRQYVQPRSMLMSSQGKAVVPQKTPTEFLIPKQGKQVFHNFNLEGEVRLEINLDLESDSIDGFGTPLMGWTSFVLVRDEYKANEKLIVLEDKAIGQPLELCARIRATEQTDLEITFYSQNCIVNNTGEDMMFWSTENKKRLPGQQEGNKVTMLSGKTAKVQASLRSEDESRQGAFNYKLRSQAFRVNIIKVSNRITVYKNPDKFFEFIVHTTWSRVSPSDNILSQLTTIEPQYVVCNETPYLLHLCQQGCQHKQVEVMPPQSRLPWYWTDAKAQQRV